MMIDVDVEDLVDEIACDKGISWSPSNCECE